MIRAGVVVISDGCFYGKRKDKSGPLITQKLRQNITTEVQSVVVPDEFIAIKETLLNLTDNLRLELIITTGGTGFGPRDVTPEVMNDIIEKDAPGIPIALLLHGLSSTPRAMLSRGRAGIRKNSLIINLPGSPSAVEDGLKTVLPVILHAMEMMQGEGHGE